MTKEDAVKSSSGLKREEVMRDGVGDRREVMLVRERREERKGRGREGGRGGAAQRRVLRI